MGRKLDTDELVGAAEIAARLELAFPQTVHDWRRRHPDFPSPVATLKMGTLWYWPEVKAWLKATGRL